jgi:hypothetical protein
MTVRPYLLTIAIGTTEHVIKNYLRTIYDKLWYESRKHPEDLN